MRVVDVHFSAVTSADRHSLIPLRTPAVRGVFDPAMAVGIGLVDRALWHAVLLVNKDREPRAVRGRKSGNEKQKGERHELCQDEIRATPDSIATVPVGSIDELLCELSVVLEILLDQHDIVGMGKPTDGWHAVARIVFRNQAGNSMNVVTEQRENRAVVAHSLAGRGD